MLFSHAEDYRGLLLGSLQSVGLVSQMLHKVFLAVFLLVFARLSFLLSVSGNNYPEAVFK